jgi:hypothetical protein
MLPPDRDDEGQVVYELSHRGCCLDSPPFSSTVWETMNLSILDTAEDAPALSLSKVNIISLIAFESYLGVTYLSNRT